MKILSISSKSRKAVNEMIEKMKIDKINYEFQIISDTDFKVLSLLKLKEVINKSNYC